jgi:hypothetical protein
MSNNLDVEPVKESTESFKTGSMSSEISHITSDGEENSSDKISVSISESPGPTVESVSQDDDIKTKIMGLFGA